MTIHKRACIIGAGSSGIATVKALADASIDFDCFEKGDRVGGNWVYGNNNGMSSAYEGLYINTSRDRMQYADYPMPREYPDFPHHTQIARYFEDYVDRFDLRSKITFRTGVVKAQLDGRGPDAKWRVRTEGDVTDERTYDFLLVANGHHWDALWPDPLYPGAKEFEGLQIHSHDYRTKETLRGKRVLVVGMGNSAMDIAVESSECATATFLSARRGVHVVPKYMFGKPLDQIVTTTKLPWSVRRKMAETIHKITVGDMERYGLPKPDHRLLDAHPTISGRILDRLTHGTIKPKPGVSKLGAKTVTFTDGTVEDVDVIVWSTGYKVTFPFFEETFVTARDNDLPLFFRVFHPEHPQLAFVGLLQPLGAIMPLAEAQSKWLAKYIRGEYALPSPNEMRRTMDSERKKMFARYVPSKRHKMQVDFDDYLDDMASEVARGTRRAGRAQKT